MFRRGQLVGQEVAVDVLRDAGEVKQPAVGPDHDGPLGAGDTDARQISSGTSRKLAGQVGADRLQQRTGIGERLLRGIRPVDQHEGAVEAGGP